MIKGIHHVALLVDDLDRARTFAESVLGLPPRGVQALDYRGVRVALYQLGDILLELIDPEQPGPVRDVYEQRGPGFFHLALETDDIVAEMERLRRAGVEFRDEQPRDGLDWKVASLASDSPLDVLLQLAEEPGN